MRLFAVAAAMLFAACAESNTASQEVVDERPYGGWQNLAWGMSVDEAYAALEALEFATPTEIEGHLIRGSYKIGNQEYDMIARVTLQPDNWPWRGLDGVMLLSRGDEGCGGIVGALSDVYGSPYDVTLSDGDGAYSRIGNIQTAAWRDRVDNTRVAFWYSDDEKGDRCGIDYAPLMSPAMRAL